MSKFINFRVGSHVVSLVVAVAFLMASSAKADFVEVLCEANGSRLIEFSTSAAGLTTTSYGFSQTYTLGNEGSYFTSVTLNPDSITMALRHTVNNFGLTGTPGFDASNPEGYDVTIGWSGTISVIAGGNAKGKTYENQILTKTGVHYSPESLFEGVIGRTSSDPIYAAFDDLDTIVFGKEELAGVNSIQFLVDIESITLDSTVYTGQPNILIGWSGIVDGAFTLGWESASAATPEPATMLLFGLGVAGTGIVAQRKRKGKNIVENQSR